MKTYRREAAQAFSRALSDAIDQANITNMEAARRLDIHRSRLNTYLRQENPACPCEELIQRAVEKLGLKWTPSTAAPNPPSVVVAVPSLYGIERVVILKQKNLGVEIRQQTDSEIVIEIV